MWRNCCTCMINYYVNRPRGHSQFWPIFNLSIFFCWNGVTLKIHKVIDPFFGGIPFSATPCTSPSFMWDTRTCTWTNGFEWIGWMGTIDVASTHIHFIIFYKWYRVKDASTDGLKGQRHHDGPLYSKIPWVWFHVPWWFSYACPVPRKMSPGAVPHALGYARTQGEVRHQRLAAAARMVRPWEFAGQTWFDVGTCNDIWDDVESTNWRLSTTLWTPWTLGLRHLEAHMAIPNPVSWARVWEV